MKREADREFESDHGQNVKAVDGNGKLNRYISAACPREPIFDLLYIRSELFDDSPAGRLQGRLLEGGSTQPGRMCILQKPRRMSDLDQPRPDTFCGNIYL